MIRRFLNSKLFVLLLFILIIGFIVGYDYAVVTSKAPTAPTLSTPVSAPGTALPE